MAFYYINDKRKSFDSVDELVNLLKNNAANITVLDLSEDAKDIGEEDVKALASLLTEVTGLLALNLSNNNLGAAGIKELVPALTKMTKLELLILSNNNFGDKGAEALVPALEQMKKLQLLDLNFNNFGEEDVKTLAPALEQMTGLCFLGLSGKNIEEKFLRKLANRFTHCVICANNKRYSFSVNVVGLMLTGSAVGAYLSYAIANFAGATEAPTEIAIVAGAFLGLLATDLIINRIFEKMHKEMIKDPYKSKSTILMDIFLIPECLRFSQAQTAP